MTSKFFDVVENFREERGMNMWSDGLMFDILDAFVSEMAETAKMIGALKNGDRSTEKGSKKV